MATVKFDLSALKEETEKIIVADYNEYYLRDDLCSFLKKLENFRNASEISTEEKTELDHLISKVSKRLADVRYYISMDPNGGMGNPYFEDWD